MQALSDLDVKPYSQNCWLTRRVLAIGAIKSAPSIAGGYFVPCAVWVGGPPPHEVSGVFCEVTAQRSDHQWRLSPPRWGGIIN
jgi:hypothetical protein